MMDDGWMTTDYDATTREERAVRDATTAEARACVRRRSSRANERERDARARRICVFALSLASDTRGGVDRVLVDTVPLVSREKEVS